MSRSPFLIPIELVSLSPPIDATTRNINSNHSRRFVDGNETTRSPPFCQCLRRYSVFCRRQLAYLCVIHWNLMKDSRETAGAIAFIGTNVWRLSMRGVNEMEIHEEVTGREKKFTFLLRHESLCNLEQTKSLLSFTNNQLNLDLHSTKHIIVPPALVYVLPHRHLSSANFRLLNDSNTRE